MEAYLIVLAANSKVLFLRRPEALILFHVLKKVPSPHNGTRNSFPKDRILKIRRGWNDMYLRMIL